MANEEKSQKVLQAEKKVEDAKKQLAKVIREENAKVRKAQNSHKFMMGGCVAKYFPNCWEFSEKEMNRIIACAFSNSGVQNMIETVVKERPAEKTKNVKNEVVQNAEEGGENE